MTKETYHKKEDKIILEIPFWSKRSNPYMPDNADVGEYPTLTGIIMKHRAEGNHWDDIGFAYTIDMDYKGKPDQYTSIMFHFTGEDEAFRDLCKMLEVHVVELNDEFEERI